MTLPTYHLFFGTFIDLSRKPDRNLQKEDAQFDHTLSVNRGALWVSLQDGRIKGFEWGVENLETFLEEKQWEVVIPTPTESQSEIDGDPVEEEEEDKMLEKEEENEGEKEAYGGRDTVRIFQAREEENEFFFPGFIGMHSCPHPT